MSTDMATNNGSAGTLPVTARREIRVVEDDGPLAFMMDTARFEHMNRVALAMAASVFLPLHLQGRVNGGRIAEGDWFDEKTRAANCFRVLNQAMRWNVDPFAVCDETYVVGGKLAYQGKLIAAIVNTRAGLKGRLNYKFEGQRDERKVTVTGTFKEAPDDPQSIELSVGQAKTSNQMWTKDPDQKLVYSGVVKWARRFCPEIIMGVMTDDDADRVVESTGVSPATRATLPTSSLAEVMREAPSHVGRSPNEPLPDVDDSLSRNPPADPVPLRDGGAGSEESGEALPDDVNDALPPDLSTPEKFLAAMESASVERISPSAFASLMKAIKVAHAVGRQSVRVEVYNAFVNGQLDPVTGKIID